MNTAYIFCASGVLNKEKIKIPAEKKTDIYIAADSGAKTALALNIVPDVAIGDFDSFDISDLRAENMKTITHPAQKDDTDSLLAIKYALGEGYKNIAVIGGLDGRLDHTLANLCYLKYIKKRRAFGYMTNGYNKITYLENSSLEIYKDYKYVSIIPVSRKIRGLTLSGFKYPLAGAEVNFEEPYTVSNEIAENAEHGEICISRGSALICECDDYQ